MEVQESKKHLAGVLLSPHNAGQTDDSLGGLHVCHSKSILHCFSNMFAEIAIVALMVVLLPATLEHESSQSHCFC